MVENVKPNIVYSEIYEILQILGQDFIKKLPDKLYNEIKEKRKKNYSSKFITEDNKIDENRISKEAVALFAFLNFKYFVANQEKKNQMMKIWINNSKITE